MTMQRFSSLGMDMYASTHTSDQLGNPAGSLSNSRPAVIAIPANHPAQNSHFAQRCAGSLYLSHGLGISVVNMVLGRGLRNACDADRVMFCLRLLAKAEAPCRRRSGLPVVLGRDEMEGAEYRTCSEAGLFCAPSSRL